MTEYYIDLVHAYVRGGKEADLAAIGDLREDLLQQDVTIEDLIGLHERALKTLKTSVSLDNFDEFVSRTSTCLTELTIAFSLADGRKKDLHESVQRIDRERQRLEALGQMAGGVAHEFNNLLQPIMGMAELAQEDADPDSELAEQLGLILDCAKQAATIVQGILTVARKQQGPALRSIPFAPLLRRSVEFISAILPAPVALELAINCSDEAVMCTEAELNQVLLNLVQNASDAMGGQGQVQVSLQRTWRQRGAQARAAPGVWVPDPAQPCLCLVVADQGCGMPPEIRARALQPFFTTKPPARGTGLGLAIVMGIVERWQGILEINSAPGDGTRILISLPI